MIPAPDLLREILSEADVIAEDEDGTAYLLLPVTRGMFDELCDYGAETEDLEEDDPAEDSHDAEPAEHAA